MPYTTSPVGLDNYRTTEIDVAIIFTIRRLIHLHQSASANSTITRSSSSSSIIIIIKARSSSSSVSVSIGIICGLAISAPHRVWHYRGTCITCLWPSAPRPFLPHRIESTWLDGLFSPSPLPKSDIL
ncbi:hypothetical protein CGCSCA5_v012338 [Colletotrichum siamense]|nr:hypothetical protein CGCSCA5_v012338 [Colletotrichum siamense]KAF4868108.1 hypothetical protein CGCSCA1_v012742 [Colletotrichum siamense]